MFKNKLVKWMLGMAFLCFIIMLSSCAASRKMGCPMQFSNHASPHQDLHPDLLAFTHE